MNEKNNDDIKAEEPEMEKKENEEECTVKKRTKEDRAKRKDDKRSAEQYMKILSNVPNTEDKLDVMCKKYSQMVDENRRLSLALKHSEKKVEMLLREREQLQLERSKGIMTRKRLENLCRELQKQNKIVKNESLQRVKEQEEIRKDLSEKFQGGLAQITTLMNQNIEKNAKMYEENLEINKKFKAVYEQVEQKEQQLLKVHQQMKLDLQVADAKLAKVKMEATAEKETLLKEKQQLLLKMAEYQAQIKELQATEVGLRSEISMYTDKYDEFQNALNRSNKIYGEFNVEMEKMTKKMYVLEKETSLWKQRWANSHDALLAMAADKQARDAEIATLSKKLTLLQDLCKMFQCERTKLLAQLKTQNNKAPSESNAAPAEAQEAKYAKQMDELPNLENAFEQLQVSLAKVSEVIQKNSDEIPKIAVNAIVDQKPETAKAESNEENTKQTEAVPEDAAKDSNEDSSSSKLEEEPTKPIFHIDPSTLDDATETQNVENDNQESSNTLVSMVTKITEKNLNKSIESSISEKVNEDSLDAAKVSKTEEISDKAQSEARNKPAVGEQIQSNIKETDNETEVKKQSEISEPNSKPPELESKVLGTVENIVLNVIDLEKKEVDQLQNNANNHVNEKLEFQITIEDKDTSRTSENTANEEEKRSVEDTYTNSNVIRNETLSKDLTRNNPAAINERSTEAETTNSCESAVESISTLSKNTSEVAETTNVAMTKDTTSQIEDKSEVAAETANEIVKNNSEAINDTVNKDVLPIGEAISEPAAPEVNRTPISKNAAPSKEVSAKASQLSTSENDYAEEKLRKPAPIKNGKRRKK